MRKRKRQHGHAAVTALVVLLACVSLHAETVQLIGAPPVEGTVVSLDAEALSVRVGSEARRIPVSSVVAVEFAKDRPPSLMSTPGRQVAIVADGGRIGLRGATVADGKLRGSAEFAQGLAVHADAVSWLLLPAAHEKPLDIESLVGPLRLERGDQDVLVIHGPGGAVTVPGILLGYGAAQVVLDYDGTETTMPSDKVRAIRMARPARVAGEAGKVVAETVFADGSTVAVQSIEQGQDALTLVSPSLGRLRVPRGRIALIRFQNAQVVALAELDPTVEQTPYFDEDFPWQRNRAVNGAALQLAGRVYERGIGMHARCRMEFPLKGEYRKFAAVAGIDDSVAMGAARLVVRIDDKEPALDLELARTKPPQELDVDVSGAQKLVIIADFVDGTMGSGARVDLCDAVLRK